MECLAEHHVQLDRFQIICIDMLDVLSYQARQNVTDKNLTIKNPPDRSRERIIIHVKDIFQQTSKYITPLGYLKHQRERRHALSNAS